MKKSPLIACYLKLMVTFFTIGLFSFSIVAHATSPKLTTKEKAFVDVQKYLAEGGPYIETVLAPEGEFVLIFNPEIKQWVEKRWTRGYLQELQKKLAPSLYIPLTKRGFAMAANRDTEEGKKDETNYDAIWVRDSIWVLFSLLQDPTRKEEARRLILGIWDYYASDHQIQRMKNLIQNPTLIANKMEVPHIRFDGNSPTLDDVMVDGKPEEWNHLQMDAHGLFLNGLWQALNQKIIDKTDINKKRQEVIQLFPTFFEKANFWKLEDAGAWEEINRRNSSSIAIVTRALGLWLKENSLTKTLKLNRTQLSDLIAKGLATVRRQIALGGESPDYDLYKDASLFRRADAALFNLVLPTPLPGLSEQDLRHTLAIIETLKRPAGILRYQNDSYQGGNYWIENPIKAPKKLVEKRTTEPNVNIEKKPSETGDASGLKAFLGRLEQLPPGTEAQWFFDSKLALIRLELRKLALLRKDQRQADQDLSMASLHIKRALGQMTGHKGNRPLITADGKPVKDWLLPESINTVLMDGKMYLLPSPIAPLNWAKASMSLALNQMMEALNGMDQSSMLTK